MESIITFSWALIKKLLWTFWKLSQTPDFKMKLEQKHSEHMEQRVNKKDGQRKKDVKKNLCAWRKVFIQNIHNEIFYTAHI